MDARQNGVGVKEENKSVVQDANAEGAQMSQLLCNMRKKLRKSKRMRMRKMHEEDEEEEEFVEDENQEKMEEDMHIQTEVVSDPLDDMYI